MKKEIIKKSIKQWELMIDKGLSKEEAYIQVGGIVKNSNYCFFCDELDGERTCLKCLSWNSENISLTPCTNNKSPFREWCDDEIQDQKEAAKKVLNYLKSELKKL